MSKRWTLKDDIFLVRYQGIGADFVASHDLGFTAKGAGSKRLRQLKATGVLDKIQDFIKAESTLCGWHVLAFHRSAEGREIAFDNLVEEGLPVPEHLISEVAA